MTSKQRAHYFRDLWPAACAAQGWRTGDETMRRNVTLEATGKPSTGNLTQDEITRLFDALKLLADPLNLAKAIPVANTDVGEEKNRCRQLTHVIIGQEFAEEYIARCADGLCKSEGKACWRELTSDSLLKLSYTLKTRARQRDSDADKRTEFILRKDAYHRRPETRRKKAAAREPQVVPRLVGKEQITNFPF